MIANLDKIREMHKLLSNKNRINDELLSLFGRFGLAQALRRLGMEKQQGVSALQLIISLCLFRINGESIFSIYRKDFHSLLQTGKNCYYRMLNRDSMDWRTLLMRMVVRFMAILRKEGAEETEQPRCYIVDDTTLEKTGVSMEGVSRVFGHVKHKCVLGYKLLLLAFFDGRSTIMVTNISTQSPVFQIYLPKSGKYIEYGPNSIASDFDPNTLPEVIIKSNKIRK